MIFCTKQEFDQAMLDRSDSSEFMSFVADSVERELVNKFMESIQDHKLHVVRLGEPFTKNDPKWMTTSYCQDLSDDTVVQCKNCKYNPGVPRAFYDPDIIEVYGWCRYFIDRLGGNGFCPFGKETENA